MNGSGCGMNAYDLTAFLVCWLGSIACSSVCCWALGRYGAVGRKERTR